jgi:hypothetical protein
MWLLVLPLLPPPPKRQTKNVMMCIHFTHILLNWCSFIVPTMYIFGLNICLYFLVHVNSCFVVNFLCPLLFIPSWIQIFSSALCSQILCQFHIHIEKIILLCTVILIFKERGHKSNISRIWVVVCSSWFYSAPDFIILVCCCHSPSSCTLPHFYTLLGIIIIFCLFLGQHLLWHLREFPFCLSK